MQSLRISQGVHMDKAESQTSANLSEESPTPLCLVDIANRGRREYMEKAFASATDSPQALAQNLLIIADTSESYDSPVLTVLNQIIGNSSLLDKPTVEPIQQGDSLIFGAKPTKIQLGGGRTVVIEAVEVVNGKMYLRDSTGLRYDAQPLMEPLLDALRTRSGLAGQQGRVAQDTLTRLQRNPRAAVSMLIGYIEAISESQRELPMGKPANTTITPSNSPGSREVGFRPAAGPITRMQPRTGDSVASLSPNLAATAPGKDFDAKHNLDLELIRREISAATDFAPEQKLYALRLLAEAAAKPQDLRLQKTIDMALRKGRGSSAAEGTALCLIIVIPFLASKYLESRANDLYAEEERAKVN
jgi:hypothetical protein